MSRQDRRRQDRRRERQNPITRNRPIPSLRGGSPLPPDPILTPMEIWTTMGDDDVCTLCRRYDGQVFPANSGPQPIKDTHQGCRCRRIRYTGPIPPP